MQTILNKETTIKDESSKASRGWRSFSSPFSTPHCTALLGILEEKGANLIHIVKSK